jgi:CheY-like chemotaxis protein
MDDLTKSDPISGPRSAPIVLHIEDDQSVARAVARLLRLEGHEVISAASGDEAIQLLEDGLLPDLIGDQLIALNLTALDSR